MEPTHWIPETTKSLLDVGCNTGDLLCAYRKAYPAISVAGIDINHEAIETARKKLPDAEIHQGYGFELPFQAGRFQCVTCIEVIEHVPEQYRRQLVSEMQRVLSPGGRLILRCPHAGIFSWMDAQNFRFRLPGLYRKLIAEGNRDTHYREAKEDLVWHHHFTQEELIGLAGESWEVETCEFGGLVLFPISDILRWPFYRVKRGDHWIVKVLEKIATLELAVSFGRSSYGILIVLKKR